MDVLAYIESGVIESYVLGMTDTHESAQLEQLMNQYPEIKQAVTAFEASLERSALSNAVAPKTEVKEKLFAQLKNEFAEQSTAKTIPLQSSVWVKYLAAASIILLLASSALNIYFFKQFNNVNDKYVALLSEKNGILADNKTYQTKMLDMYNSMQMMSDPAMLKVSMKGVAGKENNLATVFWDSKSKDVYLLANKLSQPNADQQYQLWAIVDGKPVDAGLLEDCNGLCKLKNIPAAQAFAITLEKKGGSATPTLTQIYVLGKV